MNFKGLVAVIILALITMASCSQNGVQTTDKNGQGSTIMDPKNQDTPDNWKRVIVRLDVTDIDRLQAQAAKEKDPAMAKSMDRKIAQRIGVVADRVLKKVDPAGARLIRRYDNLPLLALQVSPQAMAILKSLPEIMGIEADRLMTPTRKGNE